MLNLQQILNSDSISTLVGKLNTNFQQLALSGGGPQGIPGEQGIPGLPGRQGLVGPQGPLGPTGTVVGIIPFGTTAGGSTGPTGIAGPWNTNSYVYLTQRIGTGTNYVGDIWIDHFNDGFWKYIDSPDESYTGTNSPYSTSGTAGVPPSGGYFGGEGWYFYPMSGNRNAVTGDVWVSDTTTYQSKPTYEYGPSGTTNLTVKNGRFLSKYGTIWISSGNGVNGTDGILESPSLYEWGYTGIGSGSPANPGRYNSGIDRLYFKESVDSLPYLSNVTARSWIDASATGDGPASSSVEYPVIGGAQFSGRTNWVSPLYDPSLDQYTPLKFYTERRDEFISGYNFGTLGLYMISSEANAGWTSIDDESIYLKSLFVYSTRVSLSPDAANAESFTGSLSTESTKNLGEMLFDVKRLISSNQFVCSTPADLYRSSDYSSLHAYIESLDTSTSYTVTQGFISAVNGKSLTNLDANSTNFLDYGTGDGSLGSIGATGAAANGNYTRSTWYGSAFYANPSNWSQLSDSNNPSSDTSTNPNYADKMYRLAGMRERGKKTWDVNNNTQFLSELIFYTSRIDYGNLGYTGTTQLDVTNIDPTINQQSSVPSLYISSFRNIGIGTFAADDSGVFEPNARLHVRAFIGSGYTGPVYHSVQNSTDPFASYPSKIWKTAAFVSDIGNVPGNGSDDGSDNYTDVYLGGVIIPTNEYSNPLSQTGTSLTTQATNMFDVAIRREGWTPYSSGNVIPILRLGVSPAGYTGSAMIGVTAENIPTEFPFALSPLSYGDVITDNITPVGVGIHNVYPRARFHLYGKNSINEAKEGDQPFTPGSSTFSSISFPYYSSAYSSATQIVADYVGDGYQYPVGIFEYPYEVFGLSNGTTSQSAVGGSGSSNAANFPSREKIQPTRNVTPWTFADRNFGYPSSTGAINSSYKHGSLDNLFKVSQYLGFNLFRDLLNVGDDKDATRWMLGTDQSDNGGSAIIGSPSGDLAFVNIPSGRDGGSAYKAWEQKGLSTRDVLNNITLLVSKDGDIGIGNKGGWDADAYSSRERDANGNINYVPSIQSGYDARYHSPVNAGIIGSGSTAYNLPYGLVNYSGMTAIYAESLTTSSAALINSQATDGEYVRLEIGAQKFYGKNSRSSLRAGYGYPANRTLTISGGDVQSYLILDWEGYLTYTGGPTITQIYINTDIEGRITQITLSEGEDDYIDISNYYYAFVLPHPRDFDQDADTSLAIPGFVTPAGAVAAELLPIQLWDAAVSSDDSTILEIYQDSFVNDKIGTANLRLNNFIAGEGMNALQDSTAMKAARQTSPKLILTFLEADGTTIPGTNATNTSQTIGSDRPVSGTAAYRKVNTVIASAQTEASVREYWIPKADNTGGTFMVWTDHYMRKEKDGGFDDQTISTSRFYLEEVVTLEFVSGFTGSDALNQYVTSISTNDTGKSYGGYGTYLDAYDNQTMPLYVKYYNSQIGNTKYGITGTTNNAFTTSQYGIKVPVISTTAGPTSSYIYDGTGTGIIGPTGIVSSSILRNVDKYYSISNSSTNWDSGWNNSEGFQNKDSQFRFKRINSDMALIDFNMTIDVRNPNLDTGLVSPSIFPRETIDGGSPRWTQYIRMTYLPALGSGNDCDYFMKLFGNSLSFMSWSSYNQWYPGTAVSSDPNIIPGDALTNTGGPNFTMNHTYDSAHTQNLTWSGNFIDAVAAPGVDQQSSETDFREANLNSNVNSAFPGGIHSSQNLPFFATAYYNANISRLLSSSSHIGMAFGSYQGRAYNILGNDYMSRTRSCMWRIVPRIGNHYGDGNNITEGSSVKNNSFTLEIMFDKPVLHIDTPFSDWNFQRGANGSDCYPYKNLTISGQAMVRYSDSTNTQFNGGTATLLGSAPTTPPPPSISVGMTGSWAVTAGPDLGAVGSTGTINPFGTDGTYTGVWYNDNPVSGDRTTVYLFPTTDAVSPTYSWSLLQDEPGGDTGVYMTNVANGATGTSLTITGGNGFVTINNIDGPRDGYLYTPTLLVTDTSNGATATASIPFAGASD